MEYSSGVSARGGPPANESDWMQWSDDGSLPWTGFRCSIRLPWHGSPSSGGAARATSRATPYHPMEPSSQAMGTFYGAHNDECALEGRNSGNLFLRHSEVLSPLGNVGLILDDEEEE